MLVASVDSCPQVLARASLIAASVLVTVSRIDRHFRMHEIDGISSIWIDESKVCANESKINHIADGESPLTIHSRISSTSFTEYCVFPPPCDILSFVGMVEMSSHRLFTSSHSEAYFRAASLFSCVSIKSCFRFEHSAVVSDSSVDS